MSMKAAGRPQAQVERALLSAVDFAALDLNGMMFLAAYLTRLGHEARALELYRQASALQVERPEPYAMGLKLAVNQKDVDAVEWAAAGILQRGWTKDHDRLELAAERAASSAEQWLKERGDTRRLEQFQRTLADARIRDLRIRMSWSGTADLDLIVEEPRGTVCDYDHPQSRGGGVHLRDGSGPKPENCWEEYLCPSGFAGEYRITIRHIGGNVVAKRATVKVTHHASTREERVETLSVPLTGRETTLRIQLDKGRRKQLLTETTPDRRMGGALAPAPNRAARVTQQINLAKDDTRVERAKFEAEQNARIGGRGRRGQGAASAAGYTPIVQFIPEGIIMQGQAIVSADRRYVRLSMAPTFNTITDLFTFTFANFGAAAAGAP
jgi:hypothetical protein